MGDLKGDIMATKYFDTYEFMQAHNLSETDPLTSKVLFERYLEKYPDDYSTYPYYCSVLMVLGEFEAAEKILNFIKDKISHDKKFNDSKKIRIFENFTFTTMSLTTCKLLKTFFVEINGDTNEFLFE